MEKIGIEKRKEKFQKTSIEKSKEDFRALSWKKRLKLIFMPFLVYFFISLIGLTCRVRRHGFEPVENLKKQGKRWIYTSWHDNTTMGIWLVRYQNLVSMASRSRDGEALVRTAKLFGHLGVRGSSSKGGREALHELIDVVKTEKNGIISPDGPRGPRYQLQPGVVKLAQHAGVPLIPMHYEANRQWVFKRSWDRQKFPKPFSTIVVRFGEPIYIPEKMTSQAFQAQMEKVENLMMENVDKTHKLIKAL